MRGGGLALLVLAGGCNAIFGLNGDLRERDASPYEGIPPGFWAMHLTWQVLESPTGPIDYPAIANATVQIGPIDNPAELHPLTLDPNGMFLVPDTTPKPYRLIYTVDSLTTEIQTSLERGHFVVPMIGRLDRAGAPSHALINFDPTTAPGGTIQARVMTIGLWTISAFSAGNDSFTLPHSYDYQTSSTSMNGPLGSLEQARGDLTIMTQISGGDVTGYAVAPVAQLNPNPPGPTSLAQGPWRSGAAAQSESLVWNVPNTPGGTYDPNQRMMSVLAPYNVGNNVAVSWGGVIPSDQMPSFCEPVPGGLDALQFAPLSTGYGNPHAFKNPFAGADGAPTLPTAVYTQDTNFRMVGNVRLTSGFQGIELQSSASLTSVDTTYKVGLAHVTGQDITLTPAGGTPVMLVGSEGQTVTLNGAKLVDLAFATDHTVDDCIVTIYQLDVSSVIPVRRLLFQQPPPTATPFRIDASVFAPGKTYVLGAVCRNGQPGVQVMGDYTQIAYPYQTSTLYSRTFTIAP